MVQMKAALSLSRALVFVPFISHMVQMKVYKPTVSEMVLKLYIPHGSDESSFAIPLHRPVVFFISHMVQMKVISFVFFSVQTVLYIPHGSDESFLYFLFNPLQNIFISHMVQMKAMNILIIYDTKIPLYPTWFR